MRFDFPRQRFGAYFKFAQFAFEREQSGAFFEITRIAGVDELSAGDPIAVQRDVHLAGRDRFHHRFFEVGREPRVHLVRERPFENGD
jgi:hypothetical protein